MQLRITITFVSVFFYFLSGVIYNLFYSPIAGTMTAQTLNGGAVEYAAAKFLAEDGFNKLSLGILILIFFCVWTAPIYRSLSSTKN